MKKITSSLAIAAALTLGLTACSDESTPTAASSAPAPTTTTVTEKPATTTTKAAPKTTAPTTSDLSEDEIAELAYIAVLDANDIPYSNKADAIDVAHSACDALSAGATFYDLVAAAGDVFTPEQTGIILGAGIAAYCPEYLAAIPS